MMQRKGFVIFGVIAMAAGAWGLHIEPQEWLCWLAIAGILAGGLVAFVANLPPPNSTER